MEVEIIVKIITVIFGIIGAAKIIFDLSAGSKVKLRDEYRFAKEFLRDLAQEPKLHPFGRNGTPTILSPRSGQQTNNQSTLSQAGTVLAPPVSRRGELSGSVVPSGMTAQPQRGKG